MGPLSNQATDSKHRCMFWDSNCTLVLPPEEVFLPTDNFTITFHRCIMGQEQVSLVDSQYLLRRHGEWARPCQQGLITWL